MGQAIHGRPSLGRNSVGFGMAWNGTVPSRVNSAREMGQDQAEDSLPVDQAR